MDFMSDSLMGVRKFRTFNVMDDCTREALAIEINTSLSSKRIIRALEGLIAQRGKPQVIRTDNGPEFTSKEFEWWCKEQEIEIQFIQPGRPMQRVKSKGLTESTAKPFSMHTSLPIPRSTSPDKRIDGRIQPRTTP
jgi:transposase InsO family protein